MDVSKNTREISPITKERASMSPADDVLEMKVLTNEMADRLVGIGAQVQTRVGAVFDAFEKAITANRALEFLSGRARRIDAWEKEHAKRRLAELKERERIERENQHLAWLECEIARHRASGEELRGPHIDGLVDFLRLARRADRPVAVSGEAKAD